MPSNLHCKQAGWLLAFVLIITGCAAQPKNIADAIASHVDQAKVNEASTQRIEGFDSLRANAEIIDSLNRALATDNLQASRGLALEAIDDAHHLALQSIQNEMDRLPQTTWAQISQTLRADQTGAPSALQHEFTTTISNEYEQLKINITQAPSTTDLHQSLQQITQHIEPSIKTKDRFGRALPWFIFSIPSAIAMDALGSKPHTPDDHPCPQSIAYQPASAITDTPDAKLLQQHAPTLILQQDPQADYDPHANQIGFVRMDNNLDVTIDTTQPTVYAYARNIRINDCKHTQLIYTWWFPSHPALKKPFDAEAGHIEGVTLRITLDHETQPLMAETVFNCGCYYTVHPTQKIEDAARAQFGPPLKNKHLCLECAVASKFDANVTAPITQSNKPLIVRGEAGTHQVLTLGQPPKIPAQQKRNYTLRPYAQLERLTTPDNRIASMFYENGLVRGAVRPEGIFFTPIGILSSGQPRQRGTQLIHFDQYDFDAPDLLATYLRFPSCSPKTNSPLGP